jgi:plasmid stabilization system protein ParE
VNYRVTILPRAKRQLLDQTRWWSENRSTEQAFHWLEGFERTLASLVKSPDRCMIAREGAALDVVLRELHFGLRNKATHRAGFEIRNDEVIVYCVRHFAQRDLTPEDIR